MNLYTRRSDSYEGKLDPLITINLCESVKYWQVRNLESFDGKRVYSNYFIAQITTITN